MERLKQHVRSEFLNRIDEIMMFQPLKRKEIRRIVDIQFKQIQQRLADAGIQLEATSEVLDFLGEAGFDPQFGARPLRRAIQRYVEDPMAEAILTNDLTEGAKISVDRKEGADELTFKTRKQRKKKADGDPGSDAPESETETPAEDSE